MSDLNKLLNEEDVLRIIEEEFKDFSEQDFDIIVPRAYNGNEGC